MTSRRSSCFFSWFYPRKAKTHDNSWIAFLTTKPQSHGFLLIGIKFCKNNLTKCRTFFFFLISEILISLCKTLRSLLGSRCLIHWSSSRGNKPAVLRLPAVCSCHTAIQQSLFILSNFFHSPNRISYISGMVGHAVKCSLLKIWRKPHGSARQDLQKQVARNTL